MMDLLARAEADECEQVWAFKGKMRMVSGPLCGRCAWLIYSFHLKDLSRILVKRSSLTRYVTML